jgi:hypothetical protein
MNYNLLSNNDLFDYGILISCGLILGCTLYYLIRSNKINNTAIPIKNMEPLTNSKIETILDENMGTIVGANLIDFKTDSDSDTESDYDNISDYE